jgi:hypothetical protein
VMCLSNGRAGGGETHHEPDQREAHPEICGIIIATVLARAVNVMVFAAS